MKKLRMVLYYIIANTPYAVFFPVVILFTVVSVGLFLLILPFVFIWDIGQIIKPDNKFYSIFEHTEYCFRGICLELPREYIKEWKESI